MNDIGTISNLLGEAPLPVIFEDEDDEILDAGNMLPEQPSKWRMVVVDNDLPAGGMAKVGKKSIAIYYDGSLEATWNLGSNYALRDIKAKAVQFLERIKGLDQKHKFDPGMSFWTWFNEASTLKEDVNNYKRILEDEDEDILDANNFIPQGDANERVALFPNDSKDVRAARMWLENNATPDDEDQCYVLMQYCPSSEGDLKGKANAAYLLRTVAGTVEDRDNRIVIPYDRVTEIDWHDLHVLESSWDDYKKNGIVDEQQYEDLLQEEREKAWNEDDEPSFRDGNQEYHEGHYSIRTSFIMGLKEKFPAYAKEIEEFSEATGETESGQTLLAYDVFDMLCEVAKRHKIPWQGENDQYIDENAVLAKVTENTIRHYLRPVPYDQEEFNLEESKKLAMGLLEDEDDDILDADGLIPGDTPSSIRDSDPHWKIWSQFRHPPASTSIWISYKGTEEASYRFAAGASEVEVEDMLDMLYARILDSEACCPYDPAEDSFWAWLEASESSDGAEEPADGPEAQDAQAEQQDEALNEDEDDDILDAGNMLPAKAEDTWPKNHTMAEIRAACPIFFARGNNRFHGTVKTYKIGNFLILHNVHEFQGHVHVTYVVYEFTSTDYKPEGQLVYRADYTDLESAKEGIRLKSFRKESLNEDEDDDILDAEDMVPEMPHARGWTFQMDHRGNILVFYDGKYNAVHFSRVSFIQSTPEEKAEELEDLKSRAEAREKEEPYDPAVWSSFWKWLQNVKIADQI